MVVTAFGWHDLCSYPCRQSRLKGAMATRRDGMFAMRQVLPCDKSSSRTYFEFGMPPRRSGRFLAGVPDASGRPK